MRMAPRIRERSVLTRRISRLLSAALPTLALASACGGSGGSDDGSVIGTTGGTAGMDSGTAGMNTGGTGNVIGGTGGNGGGAAVGGIDSGTACSTSVFEGEVAPLDMYILMDRSSSMTGRPWDGVKQAIAGFVNAPSSVGSSVGLQLFPIGGSADCPGSAPCTQGCVQFGGTCIPDATGMLCAASDYSPPRVAIAPLPGVAQPIIDAMNDKDPSGGTPTLPAMQSAVDIATAHALTDPTRRTIIVLATDGAPNDCSSTIAAVAAEAARAAAHVPPVNTFVVGIGNVVGMNEVATAGGTNEALIVELATIADDFLSTMNLIRGAALSCEFPIGDQAPNGDPIDFRKVNVLMGAPGAADETIPQAPSQGGCHVTLGGWYYDDAISPTKITICPASCDDLRRSLGKIQIQLGCVTETLPR